MSSINQIEQQIKQLTDDLARLKDKTAEEELVVIKGRLQFCATLLPHITQSLDRFYSDTKVKLDQLQTLLDEFSPKPELENDYEDYE